MIRVGLCGLGEIGQYHLQAIEASAEAELAAVCDLDRSLAARSVSSDGAAVFTDLADMVERIELDVVDICLPHSLHRDAALMALSAGCHVILEKPMAIDLAACDEINAVAEACGLQVAVSHNQLRYGPHRRVLELLDAGALGEPIAIQARLFIGGRYGGWRQNPELAGGGLLFDAGVHRVYMMLALGGAVRAVAATMDRPRAEESFALMLDFESGARGVIQAAYYAPEGVFDDGLSVIGSKGIAEVAGCEAFFEGDLRNVPPLRLRLNGEWGQESPAGDWADSVRDSVHSILAAFAAGRAPYADGAAGREAVAVIEAAYRAAETGTKVAPAELGAQDRRA